MTDVSFQRLSMVSEAPGTDAIAKASVELTWKNATFMGESSHRNTLFAMAEAITRALDNIAAFRERIGINQVPTIRSDLWAGFIVDIGDKQGIQPLCTLAVPPEKSLRFSCSFCGLFSHGIS
jgi:hypothetical protein